VNSPPERLALLPATHVARVQPPVQTRPTISGAKLPLFHNPALQALQLALYNSSICSSKSKDVPASRGLGPAYPKTALSLSLEISVVPKTSFCPYYVGTKESFRQTIFQYVFKQMKQHIRTKQSWMSSAINSQCMERTITDGTNNQRPVLSRIRWLPRLQSTYSGDRFEPCKSNIYI
jgi:hypothetical protein